MALTTQRIAARLAIPSINLSEIIRVLDSFLPKKRKLNNDFCLCTKAQISFCSMSAVSNAKVTANLHLPHPDEELLKPSGANLQCPPVQKVRGCFESQAVLKLSANLKLCHTGQTVSFYRVMFFFFSTFFPYLVVVRIVRHEPGHPHLDIFLSRSSKKKGVRKKTASENLLQEKLVKKSEAALISAILFLATQRI